MVLAILTNICNVGTCHMIMKCGYMTGCIGQCRCLKAYMYVEEVVNSSDICLFLIFQLAVRYTEYLDNAFVLLIEENGSNMYAYTNFPIIGST